MKTLTIQSKLDAGDACIIIKDGKLMPGIITQVSINKSTKDTYIKYEVFIKGQGGLSIGSYLGPYVDEQDARKELGFTVE